MERCRGAAPGMAHTLSLSLSISASRFRRWLSKLSSLICRQENGRESMSAHVARGAACQLLRALGIDDAQGLPSTRHLEPLDAVAQRLRCLFLLQQGLLGELQLLVALLARLLELPQPSEELLRKG